MPILIKALAVCDGIYENDWLYGERTECKATCELTLRIDNVEKEIETDAEGARICSITLMTFMVYDKPVGWVVRNEQPRYDLDKTVAICPDCDKKDHERRQKKGK